MKNRLVVGAALAAVVTSTSAFARTLIWTGAVNGTWDRTTANWYEAGDADQTPTAFQSGDNVIFDDTGLQKTVTLIGDSVDKYSVGTVIFSNDVAYVWKANPEIFTTGYFTKFGNIDKWGAGELQIDFRSDIQGNFTCHEGSVKVTSASWYAGEFRSALGSLHDTRTETFLPGTKFSSSVSATFGGPSSAEKVTGLFNGAEINLAGSQTFRNVTFTNCPSFRVADSLSFYQTAKFLGHGAVKPYFAANGNSEFAIGEVGRPAWGEIFLDDVTGDGVTVDDVDDLIISNKLGSVNCNGNGWTCYLGNHFRKLGKGTLVLAGNYSAFTNDIEVVEGRLAPVGAHEGLKSGVLNWLKTGIGAVAGTRQRTITVGTNAVFEIRKNDVFGPLNTPQEWDLVVRGGKIEQKPLMVWNVGSLILENADYEYGASATSGWFTWGLLTVAKKLAFRGTKDYVLHHPGGTGYDTPYLTLGYTLSSPTDDHAVDEGSHKHFTNMWTMVEFEVASTASAEIALPIRDMPNMCYPSYGPDPNGYTYDDWKVYWFRDGIRKTGGGTLKLCGANIYTHATEVAEGTLLVNAPGTIAKSSGVTVDAGAFLGGLGKLPNAITFKDGGGVVVDLSGDRLKLPTLAAEGKVVVKVTGEESIDAVDGAALFEIADKPELNVSTWKVDYDGTGRAHGLKLSYDKSTGVVSAYRTGMTVLFK